MDFPNLGHAVIVNNVAEEMSGSQVDVEALRIAYQKIGFEVHVHSNCTDLVNYFASSIVLNLRDLHSRAERELVVREQRCM